MITTLTADKFYSTPNKYLKESIENGTVYTIPTELGNAIILNEETYLMYTDWRDEQAVYKALCESAENIKAGNLHTFDAVISDLEKRENEIIKQAIKN